MSTFTVTERAAFKRCRLQWDLSSLNRQGITPVVPANALELGTVIHKAHADWLDSFANLTNRFSSLEESYKFSAFSEIDRLRAIYKIKQGTDLPEAALASLMEAMATGLVMMKNYTNYWGEFGSLPKGYSLIQNEQELIIPVPGTWHCDLQRVEPNGRPVYFCESYRCYNEACGCGHCSLHNLQGQLDALLLSTGNQLTVLERKTYSRPPTIEALQQSDQILAYIWIMTRLVWQSSLDWQALGGEIGGAVYDGMYKRDMPVRGKDASSLFIRLEMIRPEYEINRFTGQLASELLEMGDPLVAIYNARRDWEGCWDCDFQEVDTRMSRGEDYQALLDKSYVHRLDVVTV